MKKEVQGMTIGTGAVDTVALGLRDVFKIYRDGDTDGETVALRGIDLFVERGEVVALMGRSGAGKSTLLNLIGGMDTPSAGRVMVDGRDMGRLDETGRAALRRRAIGFVFQDNNLLPYLSARENVALSAALAAAPMSCWTTWACARARHIAPTNSPAASASASAWPAPWPAPPPSSWPTRSPASSTRPRPTASSRS